MNKIEFYKYTAQGNDYIYLDLFSKQLKIPDFRNFVRKISERHFGVGADGVVLIIPHKEYDAEMRMYNANGSEGTLCGSALRCVTHFLKTVKYPLKNKFHILTKAGAKLSETGDDNPQLVKSEIGKPKFLNKKIQTFNSIDGYTVINGNKHFVTFNKLKENWQVPGEKITQLGYNFQYAKLISKQEIELRIFEIGSGATLACGTGAVATAYTAMEIFYAESRVVLKMPGGNVKVEKSKNGMFSLEGKVSLIYQGKYFYQNEI